MSFKLIVDAAVGNNKVLTVGVGRAQRLLWLSLLLTTTATAGARVPRLIIKDDTGTNVFQIDSGVTQAAGLTQRHTFFPGAPRGAAIVQGSIEIPIPRIVLLPSWSINVLDGAGSPFDPADTFAVRAGVVDFNPLAVDLSDLAIP